MSFNKTTYERVAVIQELLVNELKGFLLYKTISYPDVGYVDVDTFGLRFKLLPAPEPDDKPFKVVEIMHEDAIDNDKLFLLLVSRGYLVWIRQLKKSSHFFFTILDHKARWKAILNEALKKAKEQRGSPYRIAYLQYLLSQNSLFNIIQEDPGVFDWILT